MLPGIHRRLGVRGVSARWCIASTLRILVRIGSLVLSAACPDALAQSVFRTQPSDIRSSREHGEGLVGSCDAVVVRFS